MLFLDTVEVTKIIGKACNVLGCRDFNFTGNYYDRVSAGELKYKTHPGNCTVVVSGYGAVKGNQAVLWLCKTSFPAGKIWKYLKECVFSQVIVRESFRKL